MNREAKVMCMDVEAIYTHGRTFFASLGEMALVDKKVKRYEDGGKVK